MFNPDFYVRTIGGKKIEGQIKMEESRREMDGGEERQSEAQQQICISYRACVLSPHKQITDIGLKPMRHIIVHEAPRKHLAETAKYNIALQKPD